MINESVPQKIVTFIEEHHVLTLATFGGDIPYCANCFYVYNKEDNCFICLSDTNTKHISDLLYLTKVAGSIVLETKTVGKIQGLQFNATIEQPLEDAYKKAKHLYLKKYPYAVLSNTQIWCIRPYFLKYTDNRLGFGKKIIWGELDG